ARQKLGLRFLAYVQVKKYNFYPSRQGLILFLSEPLGWLCLHRRRGKA
ncbi:MAG: hypothetical protein ACI932_001377, partial [Paracoccaceae bacterium]